MAPIALTGRYLTQTSDFLALTSEDRLIEAADDRKNPATDYDTWQTFAAGDAVAYAQAVATVNSAVAKAEGIVEAFGRGRYVIPYAPIDGIVKSLAVELAWIDLRFRQGNLKQEDKDRAIEALMDYGALITDGTLVLTSLLIDAVDGGEGDVYAYGGASRRFSQALFEGDDPSIIRR